MSDDQTPSIRAKNIDGGIAIGANAQATGRGGSITNHAPPPIPAPAPSPPQAAPVRRGFLQTVRSVIEGTIGSLIATFLTR